MKVLVFISGAATNGLDSPSAGEGRWGQNLAKMLAKYGHEVDCVGGSRWHPPSWGSASPIPNVRLMPEIDTQKQYDLVLYTPWENLDVGERGNYGSCLTLPIKSKWFVHNTFGWGRSIDTDHTCYNHNHALVYPYIQDSAQFPPLGPDNHFRTYALPLPVFEELADITNLSDRRNIFWTSKAVFHPDWPSDHHVLQLGRNAVKALLRLSKDYNFNLYILDGHYFKTSYHSRRLKIMEYIDQIPNTTLFDSLIPKDQLMDILGKSRVSIVISGLLGSFAECIAMGSVPLTYEGYIQRASAGRLGVMMNSHTATEDEVYENIRRLYTDDELYHSVIDAYRDEIKYHKYSTVYEDYFVPMVKDLGLSL